jgi:hypothetical protein
MFTPGRGSKVSKVLWGPLLSSSHRPITYDTKHIFHNALRQSFANSTVPELSIIWNHRLVEQEDVHQYFDDMLTGFDIVGATLTPGRERDSNATGSLVLSHERPYLGLWHPNVVGRLITVNFKVSFEAEMNLIATIQYTCDFERTLLKHDCPIEALRQPSLTFGPAPAL